MTTLTPITEKFILHWGEMGTRWGVNRTVAQVHALLYISPQPLNAEEISEVLSIARSNVSTSLKELQNWGLIRTVNILGDRRDHFETLSDVWEMFRIVIEERKRREVDPTLAVLRSCVTELDQGRGGDAFVKKRLQEMLGFFETADTVFGQLRSIPTASLVKLGKVGGKLRKLLSMVIGL